MKKLFVLLLLPIMGLSSCISSFEDRNAVPNEEVIIALVDTGVSTAAIHAENLLPGWNYVTNSKDTEDRINHGTAVASVIAGSESAGVTGIAPVIRIVPIVITDKINGDITAVSAEVLAQAIRDSVDKYGACIINVSLGIQTDDATLREAVEYVNKQGALVVSAVGNSGESQELYYPAAYEGVLAVGSHDKNGQISDFTQQNGVLDILAPGEDIWLASRNGKTYGTKGTSYATGYVSAAAALLWQQNTSRKAEDIRKMLVSSARNVDGWYVLDIKAAISLGLE